MGAEFCSRRNSKRKALKQKCIWLLEGLRDSMARERNEFGGRKHGLVGGSLGEGPSAPALSLEFPSLHLLLVTQPPTY